MCISRDAHDTPPRVQHFSAFHYVGAFGVVCKATLVKDLFTQSVAVKMARSECTCILNLHDTVYITTNYIYVPLSLKNVALI